MVATFIRGLFFFFLFASGDAGGRSHTSMNYPPTSLADNSSMEIRRLDSFADIKLRALTLTREPLSAASVAVKGAGNDSGESKHPHPVVPGYRPVQPGHTEGPFPFFFPKLFDTFTARVLARKDNNEVKRKKDNWKSYEKTNFLSKGKSLKIHASVVDLLG